MKKIFTVLVLLSLSAVSMAEGGKKKGLATGGQGYGMAGCGLGSILFGEDDSTILQVFASTTNGAYWNQTFAMSSGTSNCAPEGGNKQAALEKFVEGNKVSLANDVSRGQGESFTALANILGCSNQDMGGVLQPKYSEIFSPDANSAQISDRIIHTLKVEPKIQKICPELG